MKIILFTIRNPKACHYALFGYKDTLERMGHEVLECGFPSNAVSDIQKIKAQMPTIERMNRSDVVLSSYHEYVQPWLAATYGDEWKKLTVPIIARFDESMDRMDLQLPQRVPELKRWATHYSFPASQDAKKFGGEWHPFGVDTTIFKTREEPKKYNVAFIGSLYPSRQNYLNYLAKYIPENILFHYGPVEVHDLGGWCERESTELLAKNYAQIRIFFCLPPMSRLIVEKVFDVMGSGTLVMYPRLFGESETNLALLDDGKEIVYYDVGEFIQNGKQIKYLLANPDEISRIALAGQKKVNEKYTLEILVQNLLKMAGKHETLQQAAGSAAD